MCLLSSKLDEKIIDFIKIKLNMTKYDIKSLKVTRFYKVTLSNSDTHRESYRVFLPPFGP